MLSITVNGFPAFIKQGSSFDFVKENNFFDNTQGFTFDMEFPLRDCPENVEAFGFINLPIMEKPTDLYFCTVQSGSVFLRGSLCIMNVDESSVTAQFIEGQDPEEMEEVLEKTFINEMELGSYPYKRSSDLFPLSHMNHWLEYNGSCLPWSSTQYGVVNNEIRVNFNPPSGMVGFPWVWTENTKYLSWQPLLIDIVRRIAENIGYEISGSFDRVLDREPRWRRAIICNSLPGSWQMTDYADAMPRWNVLEFFEKLGYLFNGSFSFNHIDRLIEFSEFEEMVSSAGTIVIDEVCSEYESTVSRDEEDADYMPMKRLKYKDSEEEIWKYWSCPAVLKAWVENSPDKILRYESWEKALPDINLNFNANNGNRNTFNHRVIYIKDIDTYFVMRANYTKGETVGLQKNGEFISGKYVMFRQMTPVNIFGPDIQDYDENASFQELDFVPVPFDWTDDGQMMLLPGNTTDDDNADQDPDMAPDFSFGQSSSSKNGVSFYIKDAPKQNKTELNSAIESKDDSKTEFYDRIYIGFLYSEDTYRYYYPNCDVAPADIMVFFNQIHTDFIGMMRLAKGKYGDSINKINPKVMYEFSFFMDEIPDINAIFVIHGQRFVCRKITAAFTDSGMSKIMKGEFYLLAD